MVSKVEPFLRYFSLFINLSKGEIHKIQQPDHIPALLEGLPLYWSSRPNCQPTRTLEDLDTRELGDCKKLDELGIVFETPILLKLESRPHDLKVYIGIQFDQHLFIFLLSTIFNKCLYFLDNSMLLTKVEIARRTRGVVAKSNAAAKSNAKLTPIDSEKTATVVVEKKWSTDHLPTVEPVDSVGHSSYH